VVTSFGEDEMMFAEVGGGGDDSDELRFGMFCGGWCEIVNEIVSNEKCVLGEAMDPIWRAREVHWMGASLWAVNNVIVRNGCVSLRFYGALWETMKRRSFSWGH
jgi:hypothetical protein